MNYHLRSSLLIIHNYKMKEVDLKIMQKIIDS